MEVRNETLAFTPRKTIPAPSGGQCTDSPVACEEAAAPVCFGLKVSSPTSRVPWCRRHPLG